MAEKLIVIPQFVEFDLPMFNEDGEEVSRQIFKCYVRGPGCPVPVVIETDEMFSAWEETHPGSNDDDSISSTQYIARAQRAELILRRDLLTRITRPSMDFDTANIIANTEQGMQILRKTGWFRTPVEDPATPDEEEDTEGEVERVSNNDATGE